MDFTPEQLARAKAANSAEELLAYANEVGLKLTEDEAKHYFDKCRGENSLSDDELDNVSGGCGSLDISSSDPRCPECGCSLVFETIQNAGLINGQNKDVYDVFVCSGCNAHYRRYWHGDEWYKD